MKRSQPFGLLLALVCASGCAGFESPTAIQAGRLALLRGDPNTALARFQSVAQTDPDYLNNFTQLQEGVWTYVGRSYYAMGMLPEARQALERARSLHDTDALAKLYLGLTLIRQQREPKTDKPLSLNDLQYALKEGVPSRRVGTLARERGIAFNPTEETDRVLKSAGADDALIKEIRKASEESGTRSAEALRSRGLKELETGLKELLAWLNYISQNTTYGRFWDPSREIRNAIQADLSLISGRDIDWQKLAAGAEWVGQQLEEEMDRARRDEQQQTNPRR